MSRLSNILESADHVVFLAGLLDLLIYYILPEKIKKRKLSIKNFMTS
jgi:hypothetical protein